MRYEPDVNEPYDECDEYIEGLIIFNGELTEHGEKVYESLKEECFDEKTGEWIWV